jgi:Flp pilus assembly pilin Flp
MGAVAWRKKMKISRIRDEIGQGLAEYALIIALIAILAIVALTFLSGQLNLVLSKIGKAL